MNLTTTQIYWLTRLPALGEFFGGMALVFTLVAFIGLVLMLGEASTTDKGSKVWKAGRCMLVTGVIVAVVFTPLYWLLPTRADLLAMYGIPALRESGILTADQIRVLDMLASGMK